ncbi:hypothetical protein TVAG_425130 [Trichomonas vaginalis G3]|uniref:DUF3447 domain-containing protein n=1 Tax=Trichomonas vaginalis (strain ATCC PRA-98 / G3) TaxID=412133 RepID=A2F5G3_TRIV3|nr:spectrin binding [Trichomonas vaginalis G3]EAX99876.1 hypothetical protein TVAG_425130 [Trichomonas vaginalis G3]KAI5504861.1 spectrin binding [Trichomonas vaginalis G3]|eukprot:XP_001312806.1 hypothetical protein [Trichomonas vaginalis G3]
MHPVSSVFVPNKLKKYSQLDDAILNIHENSINETLSFIQTNFNSNELTFIFNRIIQISKIRLTSRRDLADLYIRVCILFDEKIDFKHILSASNPFAFQIISEITKFVNVDHILPSNFAISNIQENLLHKFIYLYQKNSIKSIIKADNVELLKNFVNENRKFDFRTKKSISAFYNLGKRCKVSLLGFAAHYGALNCFNYLLNQGLQPNLNEAHHAIIGGNTDIIENYKEEIPNCLETAILWNRNEIADYILSNDEEIMFSIESATNNIKATLFLLSCNFCDSMTLQMKKIFDGLKSAEAFKDMNLLNHLFVLN